MISIQEFQSRVDEQAALLHSLVEIESPSYDKPGLDRVGKLIRSKLEELGARVSIDRQPQAGDHIWGQWGQEWREGIVLLCHFDTVHPLGTLAVRPIEEREGRLFGPGAMDMKGGIAVLLSALKFLKDKDIWPKRPITALFTSDEETGSLTSRALIEQLARDASLVLCLEPAMLTGAMKTSRKGVGDYILEIQGRAAHAGVDPWNGRSAILELAHQVLAIHALADAEKGTTINIGVIQGGTAPNVVPSTARAEIDLRVVTPEEAQRVHQALLRLKPVLDGTQVHVSGELNRPPMPRDELMAQTFARLNEIAARLGLDIEEAGTGGGSDANFVAPLGVPVLDGLGVRGDGAHSEREFAWIDSLPERAALLAEVLMEW